MSEHKFIPSRKSKRQQRKKGKHTIINRIILIPLVFFVVFLLVSIIYLGISMRNWEKLDLDKLQNAQQTSFVYDYRDNLITEIHGLENRVKVSLRDIPTHVQEAFIAVEDVRFYKHPGFDIKRIFGALIEDIKAGGFVQGASTITQQVIRNSHLSREKVLNRKLQEVYLAYQLENLYSKEQILQAYLNLIYFGEGAYGIEAAAKTYFGKSTKELTIAEGALLAGIPKSPSKYSPFSNKEEALNRRNLIIDLMVKNDFISSQDGDKAKSEKLNLRADKSHNYPHRFFMDMALAEASQILNITEEELFTQGYHIYTTLDKELQTFIEDLYKNSDFFPKSPVSKTPCQSSLVVLSSATGQVRAVQGGREHPENDSKSIRKGFNRATQAKRQPGSAIKPIVVYSPALENYGYTPVTFIEDAPVTFGKYSPSNYDGKFRGWITLRNAVANSINIPAVRVLDDIGITNGISFAQKLGISFAKEDYTNLSIALGGFHIGISPLELSKAYTVLADNGKYKNSTTILRIEDNFGVPVYEFTPVKQQVISEETAFLMSNILQSTVEWGTATRLKSTGIPLAAKTGTVQLPNTKEFSGIEGLKDAWIVTYNPDYVITVWMGFDETNHQNYLPKGAVGGSYPAEIAKQIVNKMYSDTKASSFTKPINIVEVNLDAKSLTENKRVLLASPLTPREHIITEYFSRNSVPTTQTDYWVIPQSPTDFTLSLSQNGYPVISFTPPETFAAYYIYRIGDDNEQPVAVDKIQTGSTEIVQWTDINVNEGQRYSYFITPVHPEIQQENGLAQGSPTPTRSIVVPFDLPEETPSTLDSEDEEQSSSQDTQNDHPTGIPNDLPADEQDNLSTGNFIIELELN